ncbi:hypothetical protein Tco_1227466 [Tanacetum coccineum]
MLRSSLLWFITVPIIVVVVHYSVEEVLQSPYAFQKNMKITCEEVMKISNHFQESSQKLSSYMKNHEHYTDITSSKPIKPQSEWINLMHGEQLPKTLKFQQQKKQSKPCEAYKQSYNVRPKSALENPLKTTTGLTKEKTSEFKNKEARRILIELEALAQRLRRNNI